MTGSPEPETGPEAAEALPCGLCDECEAGIQCRETPSLEDLENSEN